MIIELLNTDSKKQPLGTVSHPKSILQNLFNDMLSKDNFPGNRKFGNITPVSEKKDPFKKENCKPVGVLSAI